MSHVYKLFVYLERKSLIHYDVGGAMWGSLLDYRHHTGDKTYDDVTSTAMLFQVGDNRDFMPRNWSASMGNDDQAFWALSSLVAAETGFTDPAADEPQWLSLAQAVFNEQTHEERRVPAGSRCEWGLRWQVYQTNNGFDYINSRSSQERVSRFGKTCD